MGIMIEAEHLSHSFGEKKVLEDISFKAEKGEITGLLGPSGAGKTTLINILTGQLKADSGCYRISQEGDAQDGPRTVTGVMMDSFGLYDRLSVWDNMKIFARIYKAPEDRIYRLLAKADMLDSRKVPVGRLSKGMRNRVNLCRALLKNAQILFLDEPASGLDPATAVKIHEMIMEEKEQKTTIFLTTHNMHEAEQLCDSILLLNEGRIVEYGKPKEICMKYNFLNTIEIVLKNGETRVLKNSSQSAAGLAECMAREVVLSIHSSEPDLEKVFLSITGRRLNE